MLVSMIVSASFTKSMSVFPFASPTGVVDSVSRV